MGAPRPDMQDVVLVDVHLDAAAEPGSGGSVGDAGLTDASPATARGGLRRARRWWPVAAGLALVVVAGSVVADRRESARVGALADVPGILAPLDGQVTEVWRSEDARFSDLAAVAGLLIGVENDRDGSVDVVALDPANGSAVWSVAARPPGVLGTWARCAWPAPEAGTGAATAVVACVVVDESFTHENAAGVWPYATGARLLVLDATTGAELSDAAIEPSTSIAAIGTDLVMSYVDDDGRVHVSRTDPRGEHDRWTFTSPDPLPINTAGRQQAWVSVVDDLVLVSAGSGWVLSGAGDVVHAWSSDPTSWDGGRVEVLAGGRLLAETGTADAGASGSNLVDLATGRSFTDGGYAIAPTPDDGSLAGLVLAQSPLSSTMVAYDYASGRPRWTSTRSGGGDVVVGALVVLDGRVIRAEADDLRAVDGRTGETVWVTPIPKPAQSSLFSDGRVVLRAVSDADLGLVLAAYGLADGRLVWRTDIPDDLNLFTIAGRLYGASDDDLIALA